MPINRSVVIALVFLLLVSTCILSFDVFVGRRVVRQIQTIHYQETAREVVRCESREKDSGEDTTWSVDIEYTYQVGNQTYSSQRVRYLTLWGRRWVEDFVAEHPAGSIVAVYYDPDDPHQAVLIPGLGGQEFFMALFLLPFNVIALAGWAALLVYWRLGGERLRRFGDGFRLIERQDEIRISLPSFGPPVLAAVLMLSFGAIPVIFGVFCCGGTPPALGATLVGWTVLLAVTGLVTLRSAWRIASGKADLVIDRRRQTLTLPRTFGRKAPVIVALADILAVEVVRVQRSEDIKCSVVLRWRDVAGEAREEKLAEEGSDAQEAERIATLIRLKAAGKE